MFASDLDHLNYRENISFVYVDNPSDYPRISRSTVNVVPGSPIVLQCSLSTTGNPPITWSWYCNDVIVAKGFRHRGKTTELSFVADHADDKEECYCRARGSQFISGILYDSKSSKSFIRISGSLSYLLWMFCPFPYTNQLTGSDRFLFRNKRLSNVQL